MKCSLIRSVAFIRVLPLFGGVTPILGTFWRLGRFPVKTVCQTGLPEDANQQRKRYISEALPRVYLGPGHAGSAKYTLGRTSEMTLEGWSRFLCWLGFPGRPGLHTVFTGNPPKWTKWPQITSKKGVPTFFARFLSCTFINIFPGADWSSKMVFF